MASISINNMVNRRGLIFIFLSVVLISSCSRPAEEVAAPVDVKIKIDQPSMPEISSAPKSLPDILFDGRLEGPDLTEGQFTVLYGNAIQGAAPRSKVVVKAPLILAIRVDPKDQHDCKIDLHKLWLSCKSRPGHRKEFCLPQLRSFLSMINFVNQPLQGQEDIDKIVPLVRNERFVDLISHGRQGTDLYFEKTFGNLFIVYAVHDLQAPKMLDSDFLTNYAKIRKEDLKSVSLKNLEGLVAHQIVLRAEGPIFAVSAGGEYEPSLLLLDKVMQAFASKVKGKLVVSIPTKDSLFICGDETPGALQKLREVTEREIIRAKQPISDKCFIFDQGQWKIFKAFDS